MMRAVHSPYIRRLIFVIPDPPLRILIGDWAALRIVYAECGNKSCILASGHRPARLSASLSMGDVPQIVFHALCDFGTNVLIF